MTIAPFFRTIVAQGNLILILWIKKKWKWRTLCEPVAFLKYIVVIISICCLIFSVFVVSFLPWREIQFQSNRFVSKILESYFCLGKKASFDCKFGLLQLGVASKGIYFFRIFLWSVCHLFFIICYLFTCHLLFIICHF